MCPPPLEPPFYGGRQLGGLGGYRKGVGGSADTLYLVFRSRSLGGMRESGTPLVESAFVAVGSSCAVWKCRAARCAAPMAENGPGTLARQSQAQSWNCNSCNFPHSQAPVGRRKFRPATPFLRAGNFLPNLRDNPRNGGPGVSGPMGTKCPSAASPGDSLVTFLSLRKSLAARRQRNLLRKKDGSEIPRKK